MKIKVLCKSCGKQVTEVVKDQVTDNDLSMYERSCACEEHGGNIYEYDEEGNLLSETIVVLAIRLED